MAARWRADFDRRPTSHLTHELRSGLVRAERPDLLRVLRRHGNPPLRRLLFEEQRRDVLRQLVSAGRTQTSSRSRGSSQVHYFGGASVSAASTGPVRERRMGNGDDSHAGDEGRVFGSVLQGGKLGDLMEVLLANLSRREDIQETFAVVRKDLATAAGNTVRIVFFFHRILQKQSHPNLCLSGRRN